MVLPSSNRHYALNDRTINLLMEGKIGTNAVIGGPDEPTISDAEISELLEQEKLILTVVKLKVDKQRPGGACFSFLYKAVYDLSKHGISKSIDEGNCNHNCLYLALQAGGLPDIKLQELTLTLRNRHIHRCDLSYVCNTLEINIELIPSRTDGKKSDVEHYPSSPYIVYNGKYNLGFG